MTVRVANFVDTPAIVKIIAEAHARWRHGPVTTFDEIAAKQLIMQALHRHGHMNYGGSLVLVSERAGEVRGFVIGILDLLQPVVKELKVTDLLFIFGEGADPRDARVMVNKLIEWGEKNPKCVKVLLGCTDDLGDWSRTAKLYKRIGLTECGGLFALEYDREQRKAEGF